MKINAVSNHNYAQNNKNQNFKGLYFKEKTWQTIGENLNLKEIRAMNDAAKDVINLETLLGRDISEPVFEHLLLKLGDSGKNLKLLYKPFIDIRHTTMSTCGPFGPGEMKVPYYYALGGKFEIQGYVPPLPHYSCHDITIDGFTKENGEKIPALMLKFDCDNDDTSLFQVYAQCNGQKKSVENMKRNLEAHGFIPNEKCPVPTANFVKTVVKAVYNYLLDENIAKMTNAEKAQLLDETEVLRQKYAEEQLGNFVYSV